MQIGLNAGFVLCGEENHEMSSPATLAWKICSPNFFISQQNYEEADCNTAYSAYFT